MIEAPWLLPTQNVTGVRNYPLYALSLVAWFLAFAIYSIQCGAILAVAYLAFTRPPGEWCLSSAIRAAAIDTLPYALLFALFALIWRKPLILLELRGHFCENVVPRL